MMKKILAALVTATLVCATVVTPVQAADSAKPTAANPFPNKGEVLEVIDTSMYTYLQVSSNSGPVWIAAPHLDIAKGDSVSYPGGMVMSNFHSKSLNRTFPTILFVEQVVKTGK